MIGKGFWWRYLLLQKTKYQKAAHIFMLWFLQHYFHMSSEYVCIALLITTRNPIDPLKGTLIITLLITTREPLSKAQKVAALQIIQT